MYYAINQNGEKQSLYHLKPDELHRIKSELFHCPNCHEQLLVRSGPKVSPHFAHFPRSDCALQKGESVLHEKGKWDLYQWIRSQGYKVELEAYLKDIQQRPDVLLHMNGKRVAFEYQCATIATKEVEKRNKAYLRAGIFPLWVLGVNQLRKQNLHQISMNNFLRSFLYFFHNHFHLYFYDPECEEMIILTDLQFVETSSIAGDFHNQPLASLTFPQLFSFRNPSNKYPLSHSWERLLYNHRTKYRANVGSEERQFRQYLYLKGHHFSLIPSICYLPVRSQLSVETKPYIWQTRLIMDHFLNKSIGQSGWFPRVVNHSTVNEYQADVAQEYVDLLDALGVLKKVNDHEWVKKKDVAFHQTMKNALEEDKTMVKQLKNLQRIHI
ncbi:competence protein CoiA [Halobacillus sp. BBL2006]|uniref:competence protein CoiA n=1 Tax=Halobacillus sp. BBL2006 TaxID=1543706 RepID=UPI000543A577|nr:competence protein CoiA family protein [Halobacillus sp. BBL2006]KHE70951.1 hypothetical protein LD39_10835 [Halobacillus sp. BBL2006]